MQYIYCETLKLIDWVVDGPRVAKRKMTLFACVLKSTFNLNTKCARPFTSSKTAWARGQLCVLSITLLAFR